MYLVPVSCAFMSSHITSLIGAFIFLVSINTFLNIYTYCNYLPAISFPLLITVRHVVSFAIRNIAALQKIKFAIALQEIRLYRADVKTVTFDTIALENTVLEKMDIANDQ